jgi:RNA polymerase sigma-70 factor (ECF subfamily)
MNEHVPEINDIVIKYGDSLQKLAFHLTGHKEDADDLFQETLLRAYRYAGNFRGESSLKTWLTRILINSFLQEKRKKREHISLCLDYLPAPDWSQNPEKIIVKRELEWCITHTLSQHLHPRYSAALAMREFEGMSYKEIAESLSVTLAVAKSLIFRGRRAFRRHLEKSGCFAYVKDYDCICEGVKDGFSF